MGFNSGFKGLKWNLLYVPHKLLHVYIFSQYGTTECSKSDRFCGDCCVMHSVWRIAQLCWCSF